MVDLVLLVVSVVKPSAALTTPGRLFQHLSETKCLQQRSEDRTVVRNPLCGGTQECTEQAGIKEMQLGRLYQPLQLAPKPRFHLTNKKQLLQNGDVLPGGLVVKSNLAAHLREIGE